MTAIRATLPNGMTAVAIVDVIEPKEEGGYVVERAWGAGAPGQFLSPYSVAAGSDGSIYVVDRGVNTVHKFDSSGSYLTQWGLYGLPKMTNYYCESIAPAPDGTLVVATDYCIYRHDSSGHVIEQWGTSGTADGQLYQVSSVAVAPDGSIYLMENSSGRIQKFDAHGNFLVRWGSSGSGDGQFDHPAAITTDSQGYVYVADEYNSRIQKFDSSGAFILKWAITNSSGHAAYPTGIACDSSDSLYVASSDGIRKYDKAGNLVSSWSTSGSLPDKIAVGPNGAIYVSIGQTVCKYDQQGHCLAQWGKPREGTLYQPCSILSSSGSLYVCDRNKTQRFDESGSYLSELSYSGHGVALDASGNIYVASGSLMKYDANGNVLKYKSAPSGGDYCALAFASNGDLFVLDETNCTITRFDSNWNVITKWGSLGSGNGQFYYPTHIAVTPSGRLYVADLFNNRVECFDLNGNFLSNWKVADEYSNWQPHDVTADANGNVFVSTNGIWLFDVNGTNLDHWGSWSPTLDYGGISGDAIAIDSAGDIYVADEIRANQIQKFIPVTASALKAKGNVDGASVSLFGQAVTSTLDDCVYAESLDRSSGIKVTGVNASKGDWLWIKGTITTTNGERALQANWTRKLGTQDINPVGIGNLSIGGGKCGLQNATHGWRYGVEGEQTLGEMQGLNNIGLLVKTWGWVQSTDSQAHTFIIDDGSGANLKCIVPAALSLPSEDTFITVTGISSCELNADNDEIPVLRVREFGN